ncbi:transglutaminase-like domain-containing protein [Pontibacter harenae]|uniref:transglutaminase-like domain-containing protein n=1 Tax=Pontibacter harenae TaxID=2894083 RepID=UPI001E494618|nr:transglutaminase family protein [Pontibacter harenae]MCC9168934.1 transglutaminase family protein [Pontibacter harenae]
MKFEVAVNIAYEAKSASTLILNVQPYKFDGQLVIEENFHVKPDLKMQELLSDTGEKRFQVVEVAEAGNISIGYKATVENEIKAIPAEYLVDVPIHKMPVAALSYLNPSRYCQSDRLYKFASNKFGNRESAFHKVIAICDWINENVEYSGGHTDAQTSAYDTITEQIGVCRDFAHLGVAFCRALTIPARYLTCYAYQLQPPDFHACFEAYLGGYWIIFDATKLAPINGLVKIATGPDAADTAFASIFGNLNFQSLDVSSRLLSDEFQKADYSTATQGYSYM